MSKIRIKKKILIGFCLCLSLLLIGSTFKGVPLGVLLNDYQEECYLYENIVITTRYCHGHLMNFTSVDNETQEYCFSSWDGRGWETITTINFTENCLKYHLVREEV